MQLIHSIHFPRSILLALAATFTLIGASAIAATDSTDSSSRREVLEKVSIDSLHFVGTLTREDCWDGLLRTPDNLVHRVRVGSQVGQHGRVVAITKDGITISEIVENDTGGSSERKVELKRELIYPPQRPRLLVL